MDELRLAQFNFLFSTKQRLELLKKVNVHYSLQAHPHQSALTKLYFGKTYLHVAVQKSCYESVYALLNRNVDLCKQSANFAPEESSSPLHLALRYLNLKPVNIWKKMGRLKHLMADILLSAQVEIDNITNPKNEHGISHFHIACIVNHTEAIKFFLNIGEPIDQAFNSNWKFTEYTALHCGIRYSSVDAVKLLVDRGADINIKNAHGKSSLHLLLERLMNLADYIYLGKSGCCSVVKAEIESLEMILSHILKNKNAEETNFVDNIGLSALHMACALSDKSILKNMLKQTIDLNESIEYDRDFCPGYTAMHFAAYCNFGAVKLLLERGCKILRNADEKTALDICIERYSPRVMHSILICNPELGDILLSDGSTLSNILLIMDNCNNFNNYLQRLVHVNVHISADSLHWPKNTILHLSVMMNEKTKDLQTFYNETFYSMNVDATEQSYNCTKDEENAYLTRIHLCLVRGCSLSFKNAQGFTPIHLAFKLHKINIVNMLLDYCTNDVADSYNLTHLHIACAAGHLTFVKKCLKRKIDANSAVRRSFKWYTTARFDEEKPSLIFVQPHSTLLHVAVIFGHIDIIQLLLENGADVYAQDMLGLTPIHLALRHYTSNKFLAKLLFSKTKDLKDVVSNHGLTHLHVAAFADDYGAVKKLLESGSEIEAVFKYEMVEEKKDFYDTLSHFDEQTPLYIAASYDSEHATRALIEGGADVLKKMNFDYNSKNAFIQALCYMDSDFSKCIIAKARNIYKQSIDPIMESGVTMLHIACASFDHEWIEDLLERGADVNALIQDEYNYETDEWQGYTPLYLLIVQGFMAQRIPKNLITLIKLLLKNGADVTLRGSTLTCTPLHWVFIEANKRTYSRQTLLSIVDLFLYCQILYNVNPTHLHSGLSHFHIACIRNNVEIVTKFLEKGIDVDHHIDYFHGKELSGFTGLHFALDNRHTNLARFLIARGANVRHETIEGNTPLHTGLIHNCIDLEILIMLHRYGADLSAKNLQGATPLVLLFELKGYRLDQFDFFLKQNSKFDVTCYRAFEGILGLAVKNAIPNEREMILKMLTEHDDLKIAISEGFNAIHSIISIKQDECLTVDFYVDAIEQLIKLGCKLQQLDKHGKSLIHNAVSFNNVQAVEALLKLGADINVLDFKNESPLSMSLLAMSRNHFLPKQIPQIIELLRIQACKMKIFGLLRSSVEDDMFKLIQNRCFMNDSILLKCEEEVNKMCNTEICSGLTVKTFMNDSLSIYRSLTEWEQNDVHNFFQNSKFIMKEFPELCGVMLLQYRNAVLQRVTNPVE
ncbi:ankyrin-3-like [Phymastichus coffea]|uniref:ankyrin-3-like n=1 Tax=Phymastichus coffea TaxID=108790 RepID=UPI00273C1165|nr:ankyrin-3-like [Phymastichus coffea]